MLRFLIISIAFVLAAVVAERDNEELKKWYDECMTETGLTAADAPKLKEPSFYEENQSARCLLKCMTVKMGYMDESGNMNDEKVAEDMKKMNLDEAKVKSCDEEHKSEADLCMKIYKVHKCIMGDKFLDDEF